jgi:hypothetical protein
MGVSPITDRNGNVIPLENTALPDGNVAFSAVVTDSTGNKAMLAPGGEFAQLVSSDGTKATYGYVAAGVTPVATPTDVLVIQGSATKTVRVKRIKIGGFATTAGQFIVQLIRRSAANSGGSATLTAVTPGKFDVTDPAATAVVSYVQTGNFGTLGASAGLLRTGRLFLNTATAGGTSEVVWEFATREDKAAIIRGTSDFLCLNCAGATVPNGGELDFEIEQEEDSS